MSGQGSGTEILAVSGPARDAAEDPVIPYAGMILRLDRYAPEPVRLPDGCAIRPYLPGDEAAWARFEAEAGDFPSEAEAEAYFRSAFLSEPERMAKDGLFLLCGGEPAGSCTAWHSVREGKEVGLLHWLVVSKRFRGRGFARQLCTAVLNRFSETGLMPVYLHTQPQSWKAILLYVSMGFRIQRTDTFAGRDNEYDSAMEILATVLDPGKMRLLEEASDP